MTSAVPGVIAWPIIVAMIVVVTARWRWFNGTAAERYLNSTLTLILATQLSRERAVERVISEHSPLSVTTIQQLTLCTIVLSIAPFLSVIRLLSGWDEKRARRQQFWYSLTAILLSIMMLIAGTRARHEQRMVEVSGGWDGVLVWVGFSVLPTYLAYLMVTRCYSEYRQPGVTRGEKVILSGIALAGATIGVTTWIALVMAVLQELRLLDSIDYRLQTHSRNFFWIATAIVAVSAAPPLRAVAGRLGYDTTSRVWRRLRPLWRSMVAFFPDSRLPLSPEPSARRINTVQLHRATVEVRDALLALRPYFRDVDPEQLARFTAQERVPPSERDSAALALQVAVAARARLDGMEPSTEEEPMAATPASASSNLEDEVAELVRLARWWPAAYQLATSGPAAPAIRPV